MRVYALLIVMVYNIIIWFTYERQLGFSPKYHHIHITNGVSTYIIIIINETIKEYVIEI